ncbi:hypothetical protein HPHPP2B_1378 [Helicobacter pylori Hp P-2b]|uniref:Uncharacterized protein n=1 Tax=Helicobacter pylori Hp P-2 TaxID=992073 RepID=I9VW56_HELPX|nr:hypothetical protein HPHPP2_1332 [Helicobacter pylori Hp P-2]EJC55943.1 hypothetical protein HPHPP2B_1378 [Helicobacter pylori Hp P-2b]
MKTLFFKKGGINSNKKPLKLKIFKKTTTLHPKKEILRYNTFAFAIFSFHGKLLFEDYPHKSNLWGSLFYNNLS